MTTFIAVLEKELPRDFSNAVWKPWVHCADDGQLLPGLAAWRHLRERGGLLPGENKLTVFVCQRDSLNLKIPAGQKVDYTEFAFRRDDTGLPV